MGLLDMLETRSTLENPSVSLVDALTGNGLFRSVSGPSVTEENALKYGVVWAAVNAISGDIGGMPFKLYQRLPNGGREEVRSHPVWNILQVQANEQVSAGSFRESQQAQLLLGGNNYSEIEFDNAGRAVGLWPLPPKRVRIERNNAGEVVYVVTLDGPSEPVVLSADRVLHIAGLGDGLTGFSVIRFAREAIGLGLSMEEYSARFMSNNSTPGGILSTENTLNDVAAKKLKQRWEAAQGGLENSHRVAVLEEGLKWQQMGLSAEDAQLIESREFQVRDVVRYFRIPPHKVGDLGDATFGNISEQSVEYVGDTLMPWTNRWERNVMIKLLTQKERDAGLFVKFSFQSLLRADVELRGAFYTTQFNTASITPNEIRALEERNPIEGGDTAFVQLNMVPLEDAGNMSIAERTALLLAEQGVQAIPDVETRSETRQAASPATRLRLRRLFSPLVSDATERVVRSEINAVRRQEKLLANDPDGYLNWLDDFYRNSQPEFSTRVMLPVFTAYAEAVADAAAGEVDLEAAPNDIRAFVEAYTTTFSDRYAASSRGQLNEIVEDSGELAPEAVETRLAEWEVGGGESAPRDEREADREVVELSEAVAKSVFVAAGILTLRWHINGDSCPYCRRLDGTVIRVSQNFIDANESFAGEDTDVKLVPKGSIGHAPAHRGCDCFVSPG